MWPTAPAPPVAPSAVRTGLVAASARAAEEEERQRIRAELEARVLEEALAKQAV